MNLEYTRVAIAPLEATHYGAPLRIFVIDDDVLFRERLRRLGKRHGMIVVGFDPDEDFGRLPLDGEFDAAIIDYDLGGLRGTQVSTLYRDTPILLVSGNDKAMIEADAWPPGIRSFVAKTAGAARILATAAALGKDDEL